MHVGDHAFRDQKVLDALTTPTPQPTYAELSARCPVQKNPDGSVTLLRMADIQSVNKNPATRGNGHSGGGIGLTHARSFLLISMVLNMRGGEKILNPLFSPGKLAPLEPQIRKVANDLLDTFFDTGSADVIEEWCVPLPSAIFLSIMGLPQDDLPSSMPSSGHNCGRIARSRGTSSLSR